MRQLYALITAASLFVPPILFADEETSTKITPKGFAYYQIGQIEHLTPDDGSLIPKAFDQQFAGRLTVEAVINNRIDLFDLASQLRVVVGVEGGLAAHMNDNSQKKSFLLKEAMGTYSVGDPAKVMLQLTGGYFPFKYNPEARNLGEYMYRTGTYPGYAITDFDFAKARLMGLNLSCTLLESFRIDALWTSEYTVQPYFDYSASFLAGFKLPNKLIDVGAGIDFDRILPIDPEKTTDPKNIVLDKNNNPVIENGDTLKFTLQGTKVMARLTLDPKQLLPLGDILGPDDAKIYGEVIVLGLKDYGATYPDIAQRMPMMFGFNFPFFQPIDYIVNSIFNFHVFHNATTDVVSCEFEYYPSNPAHKLDIPTSGKPEPAMYPGGVSKTDWKWSVYGKFSLTKGLDLKWLFARDHFRDRDGGGNYDVIERLNGPKDWHYKLRIQYSF